MEKCEKCGGITEKVGTMDSGNSKFEKYACKACRHTSMKCVGVNSK
ncbi:MAG: hypothetical protein V3V78_00760 [Candidatus Woesearchaeota archaeon]